jgi:magnesium transporter
LAPPSTSRSTTIRVHDFDADHLDVTEIKQTEELRPYRDSARVTWIEVTGLKDTPILSEVAEIFDIHPLLLEDAVNVPVRPKAEPWGQQLLVVLQMLRSDGAGQLDRGQVSLFVGENFVLTVSEQNWDIFSPIHSRLQSGTKIRQRGTDYFSYTLVDTVVDSYFPALEALGEHVDRMEEEITEHPHHEQVHAIMAMRKQLQTLRRYLWPTRDVMRALNHDETGLFGKDAHVYLRDCADHVDHALDLTDSLIDTTGQLASLHSSHMSDALNEIMKTLTIMSTIFIPLSFLAGLYGMNFHWMPELQLKWGYPAVLGLMLAIVVGLLILFRRRGWIGRD